MLQSNPFIRKTFLFAVVLTLLNCSKKTSEVSPSNQNQLAPGVTATREYIAFESIDAYEKFFVEGSENDRAKLEKSAALNETHPSMLRAGSLRTSSSATVVDSLYPDFLKAILNIDGVTQIGEYIIRVDMANEKVLVLKSEDRDYYDDLVSGNLDNTKIMVYSTNDEVLDLLANGLPSSNERTALFCNHSKAEGREDKGNEEYMTNWRYDCKVVYQSAGIYFSLIAKANKQNKQLGLWIEASDGFEMSMDYYYTYTPKCKGTSTSTSSVTSQTTTVAHRPYESTTALERFYYAARFKNYSGFVSRIYQIGY